MSETTEMIEGLNTFKTASDLIRYIDIHRKTPCAVVLYTHVVQFAYIAGLDLSRIPKSDLFRKNNLISLNDYSAYGVGKLLSDARKRLADNLIPDNWKELFVEFFENKDRDNVVCLNNHQH